MLARQPSDDDGNLRRILKLKRSRVLVGASIFCFLLVVGIIGGIRLRKQMPYIFEIVPVENGIGIINTTVWNQRDLAVLWSEKSEGHKGSTVMKGALNQCVIDGLASGRTYTIRIRRSDPVGRVLYRSFQTETTVPETKPEYVVLVGASVGKSWDFPSLPNRTGVDGFAFGYRGYNGYDKGRVIEYLTRHELKPDTVIIKECAAYFPKELEPVIEKLPQWIDILNANGITPVLATCSPVTEENARQNPERLETIHEYNRFVRKYADENDLRVLDLEKTLRDSDTNPYLRDDYAQSDGLHLVPRAYEALDQIIIPALAGETGQTE